MTMTTHSPLGFSGAERYFNCPGSVALIVALPPDDLPADPDYTKAGTAAAAAWAWCLREGADAWEAAGQEWEGSWLTPDDMEAGQFYLDTVRQVRADCNDTPTEFLIEESFGA